MALTMALQAAGLQAGYINSVCTACVWPKLAARCRAVQCSSVSSWGTVGLRGALRKGPPLLERPVAFSASSAAAAAASSSAWCASVYLQTDSRNQLAALHVCLSPDFRAHICSLRISYNKHKSCEFCLTRDCTITAHL